jgi:glycolate oxidase
MNTATENTALTSDPSLLAKEFCSFLPSDAVLTEEEDLRPYECDGLSAYRCLPMIVV